MFVFKIMDTNMYERTHTHMRHVRTLPHTSTLVKEHQ